MVDLEVLVCRSFIASRRQDLTFQSPAPNIQYCPIRDAHKCPEQPSSQQTNVTMSGDAFDIQVRIDIINAQIPIQPSTLLTWHRLSRGIKVS